MESTAPLRTQEPPTSDAAHPGLAETMKLALTSPRSRPRMPYFSLASTTIERPSGVSSASEASCAASASSCSPPGHATQRLELGRLPVAERDGAGLVEQQRVDSPAASTARPDIASTLKRTRRSCRAMPMADSSARSWSNEGHEQRDQDHHEMLRQRKPHSSEWSRWRTRTRW